MINVDTEQEIVSYPCNGEKPANNVVETRTGAKAVITGTADNEKLKIYSNEGGLIFEYNAATGKSMINVPSGDLEINANDGNIIFNSSKSISMVASNETDERETVFRMDNDKICMNGTEVDINSQKSNFCIEETEFNGNTFSGNVTNVKLKVKRLESAVCTVIEKIKNIYQTVEGLTQLHTGRMRTIVNATLHIKSNKAFLKAEDDFKIKGEKIHLG